LQRQQASEFGQKRPILAELGQNSALLCGDDRASVTRAICLALERWASGGSARELRLHVVRLLAVLETFD
jgi:hypothetical protein